jgi:hypothetical protein
MARTYNPPICLAGGRFLPVRRCGKVLREGAFGTGAYHAPRLLGATLFVLIGMAPGAAQQGDPNAIFRRWSEPHAAGNYPAALVEAQKLEAVVKARFVVNHPDYAATLHNLGPVGK